MALGKVICFITCSLEGRLREAREETGLAALDVVAELLSEREQLSPGTAVVQKTSTVYSRPDRGSFDWVTIPRGVRVDTREAESGFVQIDYVERELPGSERISFQVTGWIPADALITSVERKLYHLTPSRSILSISRTYQGG